MTDPERRLPTVMDSSPAVGRPAGPAPAADDTRLRFRVWVAGRLADEYWLDARTADHEEIDATAARQAAIVDAAGNAGDPWLMEIYDPARPDGAAYTRWGTDVAGMVNPVAAGAGEWMTEVLAGYADGEGGGQ
jgi:hypothetical protein